MKNREQPAIGFEVRQEAADSVVSQNNLRRRLLGLRTSVKLHSDRTLVIVDQNVFPDTVLLMRDGERTPRIVNDHVPHGPNPRTLIGNLDDIFTAIRQDQIRNDPQSQQESRAQRLSPRQTEVLALLAEGNSNKEIACALGISGEVVAKHVAKILKKLGAKNRTQGVTQAIKKGLLPDPMLDNNTSHARVGRRELR